MSETVICSECGKELRLTEPGTCYFHPRGDWATSYHCVSHHQEPGFNETQDAFWGMVKLLL